MHSHMFVMVADLVDQRRETTVMTTAMTFKLVACSKISTVP
jgi:hypothetical protein